MSKTFFVENIFGKWKTKVKTPFGDEEYLINIVELFFDNNLKNQSITGTVSNTKDTINFDNGKIINNTFTCSLNLDFPIASTVFIEINKAENNKIFGLLKIDNYLCVEIFGEK